MSNKILTVKVKKDGRTIQVYKLRDGRYSIFLGDKLTVEKLETGEHQETFNENELQFNL